MQSLSVSITSLNTRKNSIVKTRENEQKTSLIYFLSLCYAFLLMGFGTGLIGPSLLKLSEHLNEPMSRTIGILFARSIFFLGGTSLGGPLIDKFPELGRTFLTVNVFIMCVVTVSIPFISSLIPMMIIHGFWALNAGLVDNLAQILIIRAYDKDRVNPYLQALHGAFGVGAFLSPLILGPFLRSDISTNRWFFAYWIIGALHIPNLVLILYYAIRDEFLVKKTETTVPEETKSMNSPDEETPTNEDSLNSRKIVILGATTLFICLYVGNESAFGSYLHSYASIHLNFEKDHAAYLNSCFWGAFAVMRMFGVVLSMKFSALQMICFDLLVSIISLSLIFLWNHSHLVLWIGATLFGVGAASLYAAVISYSGEHFVITGKRMSILAVGGAIGDGGIPLIVGYAMNSSTFGTISFTVITLATVLLTTVLFCFIVYFVGRKNKEPNKS